MDREAYYGSKFNAQTQHCDVMKSLRFQFRSEHSITEFILVLRLVSHYHTLVADMCQSLSVQH
jgi:hypothetical protein